MKTDRQLKQHVEEELDWTPDVDSSNFAVEVKDGIVTLVGHPSSYAEKLAAETGVQRVSGVKAIVVEAEVRLPSKDVMSDADIARAATSALHWTAGLKEGAILVQVEKGWVTLRGDVELNWQRHRAARRIAHTRGVTGVANMIKVGGNLAPADVGEQIGRALLRHAEREAKHIGIEVHDGVVTLSGTVESYGERESARGAAWSAPGVHAVVDHLVVE
ncbi:BON domain-containing protein [Caballeronia sp. LjRoot34]|uniref:BON domain-containing protein n=1 Tax=Caballeronia sp. LjRoot34 TaxID=3342325 RepID=UPI003ECCC996